MNYISEADIIALYGEPALLDALADPDADRATAVPKAIKAASDEIDGYLSARYRLPLASTPAVLMRPAIDITLYILVSSHTRQAEEHRVRYDDAIAFLKLLASGKGGLGADEPRVDDGAGGQTSGAYFEAEPRRFGRGRGFR
jgi:phage gp36-like protein